MLLIADEVATGFGRTGTLFASEQCGVRPDLLCLGKGITGGYLPMSATVASDRVYDAFLGPGPLASGPSTTGTPTAGTPWPRRWPCATSQLLDEWDVLANVRARGRPARPACSAERDRAARRRSREVRQRGLMAGVELAPPADGLRWGRRVCAARRRPRACCSARSATSSCSCRC